jgi:hypothetical protein
VEKPFQQRAVTGLKTLDAALALVALESPKLPNAALPQALLSPAKKSIFKLFGDKQYLNCFQIAEKAAGCSSSRLSVQFW